MRRSEAHGNGSRTLPILSCLEAVFWLQRGLLSLGVRTRGVICRGNLLHSGNFVFGEAMVRAYRLESRTAVYPRAVIDEDIIEVLLSEPTPDIALFKNRSRMPSVSRDGRYFVDYLGYDPLQGDFGLKRWIVEIYRETARNLKLVGDTRLAAKLEWLKDNVMSSMEILADVSARIAVNRGTRFCDAFPRTEDNLPTYVARLKRETPVRGPGTSEDPGVLGVMTPISRLVLPDRMT